MFRKILSTLFFRGLLAGLSFFMAIVTSQYLGAEGKGSVSLFLLNLSIVQLVANFAGGPYLVYMVPRNNFMQLLLPSYGWSILLSAAVPWVLFFTGLLEQEYILHLSIISLLYSLVNIHSMFLMGKERLNQYNVVALIQSALLAMVFIYYVLIVKERDLLTYIISLYISSGAAFLVSFLLVVGLFSSIQLGGVRHVFREMLWNGFILQAGNIAQLLNYRLSFYILDKFYPEGRKVVGVYSVAVSVAEALWLISQSISLVMYSHISNSQDKSYSIRLTVALLKLAVVCTFGGTLVLLCFPSSFYEFVFGHEFGAVRMILFPLSLGILVLSAGIILSSYFVGVGNTSLGVRASGIGLVVTLISGFLLIPSFGMNGAALTATLSYSASVIYQFYRFSKEGNIPWKDLLFSQSDISLAVKEIRGLLRSSS